MGVEQLAPARGGPELTASDDGRRTKATGVAVVLLGVVVLALWAVPPAEYVSAQWLFSYADGLLSRSLVGTVYRGLGGEMESELHTTAVVLYLLVVVALAGVIAGSVLDDRGRAHVATPLIVGLLLAPSGLPALAASLGRLDTVVVLLALGAIAVALRAGSSSPWGVGGLLLLAVLVHEAALLMVGPWLCVFLAHRRTPIVGHRRAWTEAVAAAVPAVLFILVTMIHDPAISQEALAATLGVGIVPEHDRLLVAGTHYRGLSENLALMGMWIPRNGLAGGIANTMAVVPVGMLSVLTLRAADVPLKRISATERLLFLASFSPMLLCLVAWDWGRWFSATAVLFGVTTVFVVREHGRAEEWPKRLLWTAALLTVVVTAVAGGTAEQALGLSPNQ